MRAKLFTALIALLAILVLAAPPPAIATDAMKGDGETVLTVTINGDSEGTLFAITFWGTVFRDDTESAMATWTSFQRGDGLTITATAIPFTVATAPTATVRDLATDGAILPNLPRLADCTGTGTANEGNDTRKPTTGTALVASAGNHLGQPLRR